jgi:Calx-beta domain/CHRD domain
VVVILLLGAALVSAASGTSRRSLPSLSIGDASVVEPEAGTTNAVLSVRLSRPNSKRVRVHYATQDGSAKAGEDYTATLGTLVFRPKQRVAQIRVAVLPDAAPEDDETFHVLLSRARNARLAIDSATITIPFNDLPQPFTARATLTTEASPNAHGLIVITCDIAAAQLAYTVTATGLPRDAFELHIHPNVGQQGGNLLNLTPPPANGDASGTIGANRTILLGLYERPQEYFAAVHEDPAFPAYTLTGYFSRP